MLTVAHYKSYWYVRSHYRLLNMYQTTTCTSDKLVTLKYVPLKIGVFCTYVALIVILDEVSSDIHVADVCYEYCKLRTRLG